MIAKKKQSQPVQNISVQNCLLEQKYLCAILCPRAILYAGENLTATHNFHTKKTPKIKEMKF